MMNIGVARLAASSRARINGRLLAGAGASTPRSCHDDPIADSSALQGYAIRTPLGGGVWGTVSEAVDSQGRRVALKEMHPSLVADPEARRRFSAVARLLAGVDHPHVVRVLEFVDD